MANSMDVAVDETRKFQSYIFDKHTTPNMLYEKSEDILGWLMRGKNTFNMSYEEIAANFMKQSED
jgi:hypothetical protein